MNEGIYADDTNFYMNTSVIAKTFSMSQLLVLNNYASRVNQVHALNPNFKALVRRNVMSIYQSWTSEWNYMNIQGWLLKDSGGHYVVETGYGRISCARHKSF